MIKRCEQEVNNTWKLEDIYKTNELWEKDLEKMKSLVPTVVSYKGSILSSANSLYESIKASEEIEKIMSRLYVYVVERIHEDSDVISYKEMLERLENEATKISSETSFITNELAEITREQLDRFYNDNSKLFWYKKMLEEVLKNKDRVLSPDVENLLAKEGEILGVGESIFEELAETDLKFDSFIVNDKEYEVNEANYGKVLHSESDRNIRKLIYENLFKGYIKNKSTLSLAYRQNVKETVFFSKLRKYNDALDAELDKNEIPKDVYLNLIKAVRSNLDTMHDYINLKKNILEYDSLCHYDLYYPITKDYTPRKITFNEAKEIVLEALKPLGEEYLKIINKAFDERWIDIYPNEGKKSGAHAWKCADCHPLVFLNYNDDIDSVFTLIHELGHAMHYHFSSEKQPFHLQDTPIFIAEVASTCNEVLLIKYLLENSNSAEEKKYLIERFLENFRTTVFRQTMFAEFELWTHIEVENGNVLTYENMSEKYGELVRDYYGDNFEIDEFVPFEWMRIPHFYNDYYVFQYSTSFCASVAIASKILEDENSVEKYLEFLSDGCCKYPIETLKIAGVDMSSVEPINNGLKLFNDLLNEYILLIE